MIAKSRVLSTILLIGLIAVIGFLGIRRVLSGLSDYSEDASPTLVARGVVTDVAQYAEIRAQLGDNIASQHFPQVIPPEATDVLFFFEPGFLQGGTHFQLRMKLPANQIDEQYSQLGGKAIRNYLGGDTNIHANLTDGVPTTFFYTSNNDERSFPLTYEILVLGAEPYGNSDFEWNHGTTYGVAIDRAASEIVYWLEDW